MPTVPVEGDPFLQPVEGNPFELGLKSDEGSMRGVVGDAGKHADWAKFEREARPSENVEDVRGRRQVSDPIEAVGQFLDKAAQYGEPQTDPFLQPVEGDPFAKGMTLTGNVAQVAQKLETDAAARRQKLQSMVESGPGHVAAPNPYPPGSEEWEFYEQSRQSHISAGGAQAAWNTIGRGVPFAQPGSLGAAGGGIKAFHGSPHDFEKFDVSKIGTGEGAQSYGHGLYFAENPVTAQSYRDSLSRPQLKINGEIYEKPQMPAAADWLAMSQDQQAEMVAKNMLHDASNGWDLSPKDITEKAAGTARYTANLNGGADSDYWRAVEKKIKSLEPSISTNVGKMYEVNINADPEHFLDWDKPLSEQHPKVQEALGIKDDKTDLGEFAGQKVEGAPRTVAEIMQRAHHNEMFAGDLIGKDRATPAELTQELAKRGIPGIKYLDQGSRGKGEGTHNYVVFHHSIVDILKKYGLAGLVAGGAAHFKTQPHEGDPFAESQ